MKEKPKAPKGGGDIVSIDGNHIDLLRVDYVGAPGCCSLDGTAEIHIGFGGALVPIRVTLEQYDNLIERLGWDNAEEL